MFSNTQSMKRDDEGEEGNSQAHCGGTSLDLEVSDHPATDKGRFDLHYETYLSLRMGDHHATDPGSLHPATEGSSQGQKNHQAASEPRKPAKHWRYAKFQGSTARNEISKDTDDLGGQLPVGSPRMDLTRSVLAASELPRSILGEELGSTIARLGGDSIEGVLFGGDTIAGVTSPSSRKRQSSFDPKITERKLKSPRTNDILTSSVSLKENVHQLRSKGIDSQSFPSPSPTRVGGIESHATSSSSEEVGRPFRKQYAEFAESKAPGNSGHHPLQTTLVDQGDMEHPRPREGNYFRTAAPPALTAQFGENEKSSPPTIDTAGKYNEFQDGSALHGAARNNLRLMPLDPRINNSSLLRRRAARFTDRAQDLESNSWNASSPGYVTSSVSEEAGAEFGLEIIRPLPDYKGIESETILEGYYTALVGDSTTPPGLYQAESDNIPVHPEARSGALSPEMLLCSQEEERACTEAEDFDGEYQMDYIQIKNENSSSPEAEGPASLSKTETASDSSSLLEEDVPPPMPIYSNEIHDKYLGDIEQIHVLMMNDHRLLKSLVRHVFDDRETMRRFNVNAQGSMPYMRLGHRLEQSCSDVKGVLELLTKRAALMVDKHKELALLVAGEINPHTGEAWAEYTPLPDYIPRPSPENPALNVAPFYV